MEDELFGNLKWDEGEHSSSGIMILSNGKTAEFSIDIDETDTESREAALKILKFLLANESQVRHKIAVSLIELYEAWLEGEPLIPQQLERKINLKSIEIWEDGSGGLYYTAEGELFGGHWIQVSIDADGELGEPELEG